MGKIQLDMVGKRLCEVALAFPMSDWVPTLQAEFAKTLSEFDTQLFNSALAAAMTELLGVVRDSRAAPSAAHLRDLEDLVSKARPKQHFQDAASQSGISSFVDQLMEFSVHVSDNDWARCMGVVRDVASFQIEQSPAARLFCFFLCWTAITLHTLATTQ